MGKLLKLALVLFALVGIVTTVTLFRDKETLQEHLVRLHVVANSDSETDQAQKLQVRDAVLSYLEPAMEAISDPQEAVAYLQAHLGDLEQVANEALEKAGSALQAVVSLDMEEFTTRVYDTFTLPAGIYQSLRIEIGEGEGHNWWCVVFPSLCVPATSDGFEVQAVDGGLSPALANSLSQGRYSIRFVLLDWLGQLENFFRG